MMHYCMRLKRVDEIGVSVSNCGFLEQEYPEHYLHALIPNPKRFAAFGSARAIGILLLRNWSQRQREARAWEWNTMAAKVVPIAVPEMVFSDREAGSFINVDMMLDVLDGDHTRIGCVMNEHIAGDYLCGDTSKDPSYDCLVGGIVSEEGEDCDFGWKKDARTDGQLMENGVKRSNGGMDLWHPLFDTCSTMKAAPRMDFGERSKIGGCMHLGSYIHKEDLVCFCGQKMVNSLMLSDVDLLPGLGDMLILYVLSCHFCGAHKARFAID